MTTKPFFDLSSGQVRFNVLIDEEAVWASITKQTLHYLYCRASQNDDPLATYEAHAAEIDEAVRRRVSKGSLKPVMLREIDLSPSDH